ncbi:MAG TPA: efflux RND transporter periplasmic adaptor subunit [Verrucomicrobiae bacterium]|nr:efflux RND transporter periplasmic adaptor subunit [Verrucomicrobiae bacterium]
MATEPVFSVPLTEFVSALLAERELVPRARIVAQHVFDLLDRSAVIVYVIEDQQAASWRVKAYIGEVSIDRGELPLDAGILGAVAEQRQILQFDGTNIPREEFAHLDIRQNIASLSYVPLVYGGTLLGCIEIISFDRPLPLSLLDSFLPLAECAALGIFTALAYEAERNASLHSVTRLTQLYDIEKVFNATLEMQALWPIICSKVQELTDATGVNLWMVDKDDLLLVQQSGFDPTYDAGARETGDQSIVGQVGNDAEPILLTGEDSLLRERNQRAIENPITAVMATALMDGETLVGVLEAVSCDPNLQFDDDDLFTMVQVSGSAAQALHNASLLEAERKVEILQTLVHVSGEITSTLNLERVLRAVVNGPGAVIPYERAAIALEQRGRLQLKAISGTEQINPDDPEVSRLRAILQWASLLDEEILVTQREDEINADREETREKFRHYFAESGMRAFYVVPLSDEEGRLGVVSFESSDPDFLGEVHFEMIKVIAGQATVALRNASLYQEVPFIGVLEPLIQKKNKFKALPASQRAAILALIATAAIFLAAVPIPMRVDGSAVVAAATTAQVEPEVDGVVRRVYVHEGDHVARGAVLADLDDWDYRASLSEAQAKYQSAMSQANRALASNDGAEAGIRQVQAQYWAGEVQRTQQELDKTHLRAPISGWITTPHVEDMTGRKLSSGDGFAEVQDSSAASIDVAVDEADLSLLRAGDRAAIKLEGYPTNTFHGTVTVVSPESHLVQDERVFYARVALANANGLLRPGMQGEGKIFAGWRPIGFVLLRRPVMWGYSKLWNWIGW